MTAMMTAVRVGTRYSITYVGMTTPKASPDCSASCTSAATVPACELRKLRVIKDYQLFGPIFEMAKDRLKLEDPTRPFFEITEDQYHRLQINVVWSFYRGGIEYPSGTHRVDFFRLWWRASGWRYTSQENVRIDTTRPHLLPFWTRGGRDLKAFQFWRDLRYRLENTHEPVLSGCRYDRNCTVKPSTIRQIQSF